MKKLIIYLLIILFPASVLFAVEKLQVVTTLSVYANIAEYIGGDKAEVNYIVAGDQDAHFVRPKPSYAVLLNKADLFISTGLDLELWAPTVVDMSKNEKIRSGQPGYVAASAGIDLLDKPTALSRSEGGLHIYGNPHITTSPINMKIIAENIATGFENIDPQNAAFYQSNLKKFKNEIDEKLFGKELLKLMGSSLLTKLAAKGKLIEFLKEKTYKGKKMIEFLGGWMKEALPFYGKQIVAYHKNWIYFQKVFGLEVVGYVEPKPGIPPSPKHVEKLMQDMRKHKIKVLLSANYFDEQKVKRICDKVDAEPVIVPMYVDGAPNVDNVFKLIDLWIRKLNKAFEKSIVKN